MSEIWHALGFATLAIFVAGLMVVVLLAHFSSEASEARLITNLKLRRVLWGIAWFFWGYEVVSFFLNLLWKTSPGKLYVASVAAAIVITGFIAIRGMWATYQPSS